MAHLNLKALGGAAATAMLAVCLTTLGTPAHAQTAVYSGGGTLAEKFYRDIGNCYGADGSGDLKSGSTIESAGNPGGTPPETSAVPTSGLPQPVHCATASPPPNAAGAEMLYVGVGSGNGKKAFRQYDATQFTSGARIPDSKPIASAQGGAAFGPFYGVGTGSSWVPDATTADPFPTVTFAGSDDPWVASDDTDYGTAHANTPGSVSPLAAFGPEVQVPALITAVAVAVQPTTTGWNPKGKKAAGGSSFVDLSLNTLCGIYTGNITTWQDAALKADNGSKGVKNLALDTNVSPDTITVIARADSSGTTFLFSNALIHQCARTAYPIPASWQTATGNTSGVGGNSFFINVKTAGLLPANFVIQASDSGHPTGQNTSGNGGMQAYLLNHPGTIGYMTPSVVQPAAPTGPVAANLQTYASLSAKAPVWVAPTAKGATAIMADILPPSFACTGAGCFTDSKAWGATQPTPSSAAAYPIGGFTFIDLYTCYTQASFNAVGQPVAKGKIPGLWAWYYGTAAANKSVPKAILADAAFAPIPAAWSTAVNQLLFTNANTKLRVGPAAASGAFPGCTAGAGA